MKLSSLDNRYVDYISVIRPPLDVLELVVLWVVHPEVGQVGAIRVGGGPQHEGGVGRHGDHAALTVLGVAACTVTQ